MVTIIEDPLVSVLDLKNFRFDPGPEGDRTRSQLRRILRAYRSSKPVSVRLRSPRSGSPTRFICTVAGITALPGMPARNCGITLRVAQSQYKQLDLSEIHRVRRASPEEIEAFRSSEAPRRGGGIAKMFDDAGGRKIAQRTPEEYADLLSQVRALFNSSDVARITTVPGPGFAGILTSVVAYYRTPRGNYFEITVVDPEDSRRTATITSDRISSIGVFSTAAEYSRRRQARLRIPEKSTQPSEGERLVPGRHVTLSPADPVLGGRTGPAMVSVSNLAEALILAGTALSQRGAQLDFRRISGWVLGLSNPDNPGETGASQVQLLLETVGLSAQIAAMRAGPSLLRQQSLLSGARIGLELLAAQQALGACPESAGPDQQGCPQVVEASSILNVFQHVISWASPLGAELSPGPTPQFPDGLSRQAQELQEEIRNLPRYYPEGGTGSGVVLVRDLEALRTGGDAAGQLLDVILRAVIGVLAVPDPRLDTPENRRQELVTSLRGQPLDRIAAALAHLPDHDRQAVVLELFEQASQGLIDPAPEPPGYEDESGPGLDED